MVLQLLSSGSRLTLAFFPLVPLFVCLFIYFYLFMYFVCVGSVHDRYDKEASRFSQL